MIIKEPVEEFKEKFKCLGESTEKYTTLSVPLEKETTPTTEHGEEITKTLSLRLQFISATFMGNSSNLSNNLSEGIHKIKCTNS